MRSSAQLGALRRVHDLLTAAAIEYWVIGGWAVDLHLAEVTRAHGDIDMAVWRADVDLIASLLQGDGWTHRPEQDEDGGTGYERDGVRVELTFLARDEHGCVVTPLRDRDVAWPQDAFGADVRELDGARAHVVSLAALTRAKSSARADPVDGAKDRDDFSRLAALEDQ